MLFGTLGTSLLDIFLLDTLMLFHPSTTFKIDRYCQNNSI